MHVDSFSDERATHTESSSFRAYSVRVTCRRRNSHQNRHLTTSSHLQTKQLQVWLGIHKPNHVDVCVQLPQPWRAAAHTAEPVEQGSGPIRPLNVQFTLPRVQQCRPPSETAFLLLDSEDHPKRRRILCQQSWGARLQIRNRRNPTPGSTWTPSPNVQ